MHLLPLLHSQSTGPEKGTKRKQTMTPLIKSVYMTILGHVWRNKYTTPKQYNREGEDEKI